MTTVSKPGRWLLRRPSPEAAARLFCFPYSGCGASMYNGWPRRTGGVELCPVQLPARENRMREPHHGSFESLAEQAAEALAPYLDRPFGVFGHCGGALAAFATALQLQQTGRPVPTAVFVSSQVAPHQGPYGRFLGLGRDELREELARLTLSMGGRVQPSALDLALDVLEQDMAGNRNYRLDAPVVLDTTVHAIGWSGDVEIRPDQMDGWREYAAPGRYHPVVLDGEHHAFLKAPAELMARFTEGLAL
ncbi:thioesterase II family protein [Kitasatospora sp. NPDC059648]|uniref:thioesterase II family protein n=1 Tax=Kitasatospora sp. NPDC059648 TaxID=3346894 RepID=UPI0036A00A87